MTCHNSRNSWRDSSLEKRQSVLCNCLRACSVFAFSSRSNHAWFQKNSFKQNIVLCKVEEDLCPNFLCYLKGSVNSVLSVQQDLWLHDWNQPIVLGDGSIASKSPGSFLNGEG